MCAHAAVYPEPSHMWLHHPGKVAPATGHSDCHSWAVEFKNVSVNQYQPTEEAGPGYTGETWRSAAWASAERFPLILCS